MKKLFTHSSAIFLTCFLATAQAQTLFFENFETSSTVTSVLNVYGAPPETQLPNWPVPMGSAKAGWGNAATFNSTKVDFKGSQNPSHFVGVNPETLGGAYMANVKKNGSLNFSGKDSLRFKCRYFKSTAQIWGAGGQPATLKITFSNGTTNYVIDSQFATTDNWANLDIALPGFLIAPAVTFTVTMGQEKGIGLDDIEVVNIPITTTGLNQYEVNEKIKVHPNPSSGQFTIYSDNFLSKTNISITNIFGEKIIAPKIENKNSAQITTGIDLSNQPGGVYFLNIRTNQESFSKKLIIQK